MSINLGNNEVKLDDSSMIVTETNGEGTITFVSKDFCNISGHSKEELLGQAHNIVRHDFMPSKIFKELWETVKSGKIWSGIIINTTKSGGYYWAKATVYPAKSSNGQEKFISIRVQPSKNDIDAVIDLYPTIK